MTWIFAKSWNKQYSKKKQFALPQAKKGYLTEIILKTIGIDVRKDTYSICTFNSGTKDYEHEIA